MTRPPLERQLQGQIYDALVLELGPPRRLSRLGVVWYASDISNSASKAVGARISQGIGAGVPDLMFLYRARTYYQEVKRPSGILSEEQALFIAAARLAGAECAICTDAVSCLQNLDVWGIARERRVVFPLDRITA